MQKILILAGVILVEAGVAWPLLVKLPLGKLPGDIMIDKPGMKIFFPITSMLLISALVSAVVWLVRKFQ